ncbi:MAG TPA: uracil-DNA glycosylase family protein [Ktedonobacterales bacterium]|nr:uracil-DNA glycosylase family protein [Ktedonobacterales bacterium]
MPAAPLPLIVAPPPRARDEQSAERAHQLAALHAEMRACQRCVVAGYLAQASGVAGYRGRIGNQVMLIGQAPGHLSVERGEPFSGPGGKTLDRWLTLAGYAPGALRSEVYLSAMTKCDPGRSPRGDGDRKPSPPELALCRPFLLRELELVRPAVIMLVGGMAITAFMGPQRLDDVVGRAYLSTPNGPQEITSTGELANELTDAHNVADDTNFARLLPLPHPSGVSRWMNDPAHQALVAQAIVWLARWREAAGG